MKTIKVRQVTEDISSLWITMDSNREDLIGQVIDKNYKIERYLGRGAFGKVFTVMDLNENKM